MIRDVNLYCLRLARQDNQFVKLKQNLSFLPPLPPSLPPPPLIDLGFGRERCNISGYDIGKMKNLRC